jgi:hypothetical protein
MNRGGKEACQCAGYSRKQGRMAFVFFCSIVLAVPATPALLAQNADQAKNEQSCRGFVQQFYNWYVSREILDEKMRADHPVSDDVLLLRPQVLDPILLQLLKEDSAAQARAVGEIDGLDFDPFLNSQDPSSKFVVESVALTGGHCLAAVNGIEQGKKRERVVAELVPTGKTWVFVNFHYGKSNYLEDENLIRSLNMLREERKKARP